MSTHYRTYKKFFYIFIIFFLLSANVWDTRLSDSKPTSSDIDEAVKKIAAHFIKNTLETTQDFEKAAVQMGVNTDELKQICIALNINVDFTIPEIEPKVEPIAISAFEKLSDDTYQPDVIVEYEEISPYILLVEKSTHKLYLLKYEHNTRTLINTFQCKTGKNRGDKQEEGDHKTPEGIFFFVNKYNRKQISSIVGKENAYLYGEMAYVIDFPNDIDRFYKKNGSGIWLHGTDESFVDTPSYDTRGCVVTTNETITILSKYIELKKTPLIIVDTLSFIDKEAHSEQRKELLTVLEGWRSDWEKKRIDNYIDYYSEHFRDRNRNYSQFKAYKASIFNAYEIYRIKLDNIIVLKHNDGLIVKFNQDYNASNLKTINSKELYFIKEKNSWKIIAENIRN